MSHDENLSVLKKRRATIQASCTRIKTYVDQIAVVPITTTITAELQERRAKLDKHWSDYDTVQTHIEIQDEGETVHRAGFESAFYTLSARIRELSEVPSASRHSAVPSPAFSRTSNSLETLSHVRLPKLNLPTFSGKYDEWFPFYDSFQSMIHANPSIDDIQRLQYLRASLTDEAKNVISSLEISAVNYGVAWNLLKERYDNKRVIVQNHIRAIMELPSMTKENVVELRQIADGAAKHMHALQALRRPTSHWDDLMVHILSGKLDSLSMREWQNTLTTNELPTLKQFLDFTTHRCHMLESSARPTAASSKNSTSNSQSKTRRPFAGAATVNTKCTHCRGDHSIYYCERFLTLTVPQRIAAIQKGKFCTNCLRSTEHKAAKCTSGTCRICKKKHNTLLHLTNASSDTNKEDDKSNEEAPTIVTSAISATLSSGSRGSQSIMLSTANIRVLDNKGSPKPCRVLLDCGSQANFISRKFIDVLGIRASESNISISGIGNTATKATHIASVKLQSRTSSFSATINCIVTEQVTERLPAFTIKRSTFELPRNIKLADPHFHVSADIDILIGAELFWQVLCIGRIQASSRHPMLQKTQFGWILAGRFGQSFGTANRVQVCHASITNVQLHDELKQFWQMEEFENASNFTKVEALCEQHFHDNLKQNEQGRFIVALPFKDQMRNKLGDSRDVALKRLYALEKRFKRDPSLKTQYTQFLDEYLSLGHMMQVEESKCGAGSFYLPHHCVFKQNSTKIRVVFDASCKSDSGVSLNDTLMAGPAIQQDLMSILVRFRMFLHVIAADIIKMYRQVLVDPSQTRYQRILWRGDPASEVKVYELKTVTYGTTSASYLATRCLKHLAETYREAYPTGSMRVERDFYVDDLLTGADTIIEAKTARDEIITILRAGAFELSKWASNRPELLSSLNDKKENIVTINDGADSSVLGVQWNQSSDFLHFSYRPQEICKVTSKRVIMSEAFRLFDPLGLLGPVVVLAKLIIQELWQLDSHWDESVPPDINYRWTKLRSQLSNLNQLAIPRCVKSRSETRFLQLHGFCDASERAYGACVYVRTQAANDEFRVELLASKSRVAPIKAVSLPRLELASALLLAKLVDKIATAIDLAHVPKFLWSDSMIALNWISSPSRKWAVFVANRVGEIQRLTSVDDWRHVSSANNSADILSRGLEPHELAMSQSWWHGPEFLSKNEVSWPSGNFVHLENIPELKKTFAACARVETSIVDELISKYSSLDKACRVLAYCLRFSKTYRPNPPTRFVAHTEMLAALDRMCRIVQGQSFLNEYRALKNGKVLDTTSTLLSLAPFMTTDGLIRVGGRLQNSDLSPDARHPILLPRSHELTKRVIEYEHARNAHTGVQATMAAVRQRFWPLCLRSTTRKIVQGCVTCFKVKPSHSESIMGSLPAGRVKVSRPFYHCGVDYAGPLILRECKRRNARTIKSYVAVFVCFATKAIHLELVSDLTSDAFIGALKRFVARRGKPAVMCSDNGTTFVGARRELREFYELLNKEQVQSDIRHFLRDQKTIWNFIPPNAPHFGGLWEAGVKSMKYHLYRIIGKAHLNYEEMLTVLCEIEAILNSRPIAPLSEDPNDLNHLTPGHFLVGAPLNSFPYADVSDINENRLVRWQRVEQLRQHFWSRWSSEYLNSLQERNKWKVNKGQQLKANQPVLLKQPGLAPLQWLLGRIERVHTGSDGNARVATIKTASGTYVRPLSKIAILPVDC